MFNPNPPPDLVSNINLGIPQLVDSPSLAASPSIDKSDLERTVQYLQQELHDTYFTLGDKEALLGKYSKTIVHLQIAVKQYEEQLSKQHNEKIEIIESKIAQQKQLEQQLSEISSKKLEEKQLEIQTITEEHQLEIQTITEEHQLEIQTITEKHQLEIQTITEKYQLLAGEQYEVTKLKQEVAHKQQLIDELTDLISQKTAQEQETKAAQEQETRTTRTEYQKLLHNVSAMKKNLAKEKNKSENNSLFAEKMKENLALKETELEDQQAKYEEQLQTQKIAYEKQIQPLQQQISLNANYLTRLSNSERLAREAFTSSVLNKAACMLLDELRSLLHQLWNKVISSCSTQELMDIYELDNANDIPKMLVTHSKYITNLIENAEKDIKIITDNIRGISPFIEIDNLPNLNSLAIEVIDKFNSYISKQISKKDIAEIIYVIWKLPHIFLANQSSKHLAQLNSILAHNIFPLLDQLFISLDKKLELTMKVALISKNPSEVLENYRYKIPPTIAYLLVEVYFIKIMDILSKANTQQLEIDSEFKDSNTETNLNVNAKIAIEIDEITYQKAMEFKQYDQASHLQWINSVIKLIRYIEENPKTLVSIQETFDTNTSILNYNIIYILLKTLVLQIPSSSNYAKMLSNEVIPAFQEQYEHASYRAKNGYFRFIAEVLAQNMLCSQLQDTNNGTQRTIVDQMHDTLSNYLAELRIIDPFHVVNKSTRSVKTVVSSVVDNIIDGSDITKDDKYITQLILTLNECHMILIKYAQAIYNKFVDTQDGPSPDKQLIATLQIISKEILYPFKNLLMIYDIEDNLLKTLQSFTSLLDECNNRCKSALTKYQREHAEQTSCSSSSTKLRLQKKLKSRAEGALASASSTQLPANYKATKYLAFPMINTLTKNIENVISVRGDNSADKLNEGEKANDSSSLAAKEKDKKLKP